MGLLTSQVKSLSVLFAALPSDESLVGYWAFDDGSGSVAVDGSGNGNDGTLVNMEDADWVDGVVGKALNFDVGDGPVNLPASSVIASNEITISFWASADAITANSLVWFEDANGRVVNIHFYV